MTAAVRHQQVTDDVSKGDVEKKYRVLYAEDQSSSRTVTTALLERLGYQVDAVEDGEEALTRARQNHYDIILLDIEMPVMDGVTAARMIRAEASPCHDTPILALSALIADTSAPAQWRDAFDSTLPKPANSQELKLAVGEALARSNVAWKQVDATPTIIKDLQSVLPQGAWSRLVASAAAEMNSLAITLAACLELQDQDNAKKAARALYSLASSFGAGDIAAVAQLQDTPSIRRLPAQIRLWHAKSAQQ
jgi:CheY-like chemotaxis protein